jgi:hypothetical protein
VFCVTIRPAKLYIDKEIEAINQDVGEIEKEASVRSQQRIHKLEVQQDGTFRPLKHHSSKLVEH